LELHTLKIFDSAVDAHILKSRLNNEGIVSFIFDEHIMTLNPLYNIMVGGIKLKVPETDLERARAILTEIEQTPFSDEDGTAVMCPSCGSLELYHDFKSMKGVPGFLSTFLSLFLGVFPLYFSTVYKCKVCGTEFPKKDR
jgi:DNA-directed RNA polymerase subunit RPC12/RpoP